VNQVKKKKRGHLQPIKYYDWPEQNRKVTLNELAKEWNRPRKTLINWLYIYRYNIQLIFIERQSKPRGYGATTKILANGKTYCQMAAEANCSVAVIRNHIKCKGIDVKYIPPKRQCKPQTALATSTVKIKSTFNNIGQPDIKDWKCKCPTCGKIWNYRMWFTGSIPSSGFIPKMCLNTCAVAATKVNSLALTAANIRLSVHRNAAE